MKSTQQKLEVTLKRRSYVEEQREMLKQSRVEAQELIERAKNKL